MLTYGIPPEFRGGVHYETAIRHRVSPEFIGSRNCVLMAFTAESPPARASKPQGSSERVLPWQITMDQLIFASLSHTHYWYEVGMLKVPAVECEEVFCVSIERYTRTAYEAATKRGSASSVEIARRCSCLN